MWEADATGTRTLSIQGRTDELLGRSVDELRSRGLAADVHPDDREAYLARFGARRVRAGGFDYRYVRPGGGVVWLRDQLVAAGTGQTAAVRGVSIDVTQDRRQDIAVQRYEQIAERMGSMTLVLEATDPEAGSVIVNAVDPIGWGLDDDVIGRQLKAVFPEVAAQPEIQALLDGEQRGIVRTGPWEVDSASGGVRKLEVEGFPLPVARSRCCSKWTVAWFELSLAVQLGQRAHAAVELLLGEANEKRVLAGCSRSWVDPNACVGPRPGSVFLERAVETVWTYRPVPALRRLRSLIHLRLEHIGPVALDAEGHGGSLVDVHLHHALGGAAHARAQDVAERKRVQSDAVLALAARPRLRPVHGVLRADDELAPRTFHQRLTGRVQTLAPTHRRCVGEPSGGVGELIQTRG